MPDSLYYGADASVAHGAVVAIDSDGRFVGADYYTPIKKLAKISLGGCYIPTAKKFGGEDPALGGLRRLVAIRRFVEALMLSADCVFCQEDYAQRAIGRTHHIGEVGALFKLKALDEGCRVRVHDPMSVKMFGAESGAADKDDMEAGVKRIWGWEPPSEYEGHVREDVIDAYVLAQMGRVEEMVRSGAVGLEDLRPRARELFLRVTKTYPVNLLARDYATLAWEE